MTPKEKIFFIHVPKCAGLSMTGFLANHLGGDQIVHVPNPRVIRGSIENALQSYRAIAGHFHLRDLSPAIFETAYVFTILRDPIDRVLSQYYFFRQEGAAAGPEVTRAKEKDLSAIMKDFLVPQVFSTWSNLQTLIFSGVAPGLMPQGDMLRRAKRNLEQLNLVGVYERLDETARRVAADFGWGDDIAVPVLNASPARRLRAEVDADTIANIENANAMDLELHAHAKKLFDSGYARSATGIRVEIDAIPSARRDRGTREVTIVDARVRGDGAEWRFKQGDTANIEITVRSEIKCTDLTIGLMITDVLGGQIYGTNTYLLDKKLAIQPGEVVSLCFAFAVNLAPDIYYLTIAAHPGMNDSERCFHWIDNFCSFVCEARESSEFVGLVDLRARLVT